MADGTVKLTVSQVLARATDLKNYAMEMEELLKVVKLAMDDINDQGAGIYYGSKNPVQLSAELANFSSMFYKVYEQILAEATKLSNITTTMENE